MRSGLVNPGLQRRNVTATLKTRLRSRNTTTGMVLDLRRPIPEYCAKQRNTKSEKEHD